MLQTELVTAQQVNVADRKAVSFEMIVPAGALAPGLYTCQVNVIDDTAGTFAFPRFQLYVTEVDGGQPGCYRFRALAFVLPPPACSWT